MKNKFSTKQKKLLLFIVFAQSFAFFSNLLYSNQSGFNSILNSIGIITFVCYLFSYYNNFKFDTRLFKVISFYTLFCIVPLLLYYGFDNNEVFGNNYRFKGLHKDPNFLCAYINISFAAKLFYMIIKKKLNLLLSAFLLIDLYSIFLTQSRTGIITLILFLLLFVVIFKKKLLPILLITFISCGIFISRRIKTLTYGNISNTFDRVLFRFSYNDYKGDEIRDARLDHLDNFIDIVKNNNQLIFGYTSDRYIGKFNHYPHNLFIDIILEYGFIVGSVLIFIILKLILKGFLNVMSKQDYYFFVIAITALLSMIPLSSLDQKFFWFVIVLIIVTFDKKYAY